MSELDNSFQELQDCRYMLQDQLFKQTGAMFKYCVNAGIQVPAQMYSEYDHQLQIWADICKKRIRRTNGDKETVEGKASAIDAELSSGIPAEGFNLERVAHIHNTLAEQVAPATPRAIYLIESEMQPVSLLRQILGFRFLGPIKIVRAMMASSVFVLLVFLAASLSKHVNLDNLALSLYDLSGRALFYNLAFLLAAAGIGASFAALFDLRRYIASRTYDTVYATDYWIRFFLGLISGLILAEMVPVGEIVDDDSFFADLARPVLAMLGGFSVQAVYRILQRMVQTLETLVQGKPSAKDDTAAKMEIKQEAAKQNLKTRSELLSGLGELQLALNKSGVPDELKSKVESMMSKISAKDQAGV